MRETARERDKPISASEVNRFCYCPWQWYYERVYGAPELRRRQKERNEALGLEAADPRLSVFNRGRDFHAHYRENYAARLRMRRLAAFFFILLTAVLVLVVCWRLSHA